MRADRRNIRDKGYEREKEIEGKRDIGIEQKKERREQKKERTARRRDTKKEERRERREEREYR